MRFDAVAGGYVKHLAEPVRAARGVAGYGADADNERKDVQANRRGRNADKA